MGVTTYINGDSKLSLGKFTAGSDTDGTSPTNTSLTELTTPATSVDATVGVIEHHSNLDSADIYVDGLLIGDSSATLKLGPGPHTIRV